MTNSTETVLWLAAGPALGAIVSGWRRPEPAWLAAGWTGALAAAFGESLLSQWILATLVLLVTTVLARRPVDPGQVRWSADGSARIGTAITVRDARVQAQSFGATIRCGTDGMPTQADIGRTLARFSARAATSATGHGLHAQGSTAPQTPRRTTPIRLAQPGEPAYAIPDLDTRLILARAHANGGEVVIFEGRHALARATTAQRLLAAGASTEACLWVPHSALGERFPDSPSEIATKRAA